MQNVIKAVMPEAGGQKTYHVRPGDALEFTDMDIDNMSIDILGPDIVIVDLLTNSKIVFPGLGLILFAEGEAPKIVWNGQELSANELLSYIGRIQNITQKDFLSFTSFELNPEQGAETQMGAANEAQEEDLNTNDVVDVQDFLAVLQASAAQKQAEPQDSDEDDSEIIQDDRSDVINQSSGVPQVAPPASSSATSNASDVSSEDETETDTSASAVVTTSEAAFALDTRILQSSFLEPGVGGDVFGGGGTTLSVFDPADTVQYLAENIDKSTDNSGLTIFGDDPTFFNATQGARSIQYSPSLPDDFDVTEVRVVIDNTSGGIAASDFTIYSVNLTGVAGSQDYNEIPATFDGIDTFTVASGDITQDSRGDINLIIVYNLDNEGETFDLTLEADATFTGLGPPPPQPLQTDSETKNVTITGTPGATTDTAWFLETVPNSNIIQVGDGADTVYGGQGADTITTNQGDDTIYADYGDGGGGDDIDGGEGGETGGDTVSYGEFTVNTITYTARSEDITVDLSGGANNVTFAGSLEQDTLTNIENFISGSGNDNITGSADVNRLQGGDGDDTFVASAGDDFIFGGIDGGADTSVDDLVDYSATANVLSVNLTTGAVLGGVDVGNDTLDGIEHVTGGTNNDNFVGNAADNIIDGGTGGTDTVDYSSVAANGVNVDLSMNSAVDIAGTAIGTDTLNNIDNVTGTGNVDIITGDLNANELRGGAGADTIDGGAGDDVIFGGTGSDTLLDGGADTGGDELRYDDLADTFTVNFSALAGTDGTVAAGGGDVDTFQNFEEIYLSSNDDIVNGSVNADVIVYGLGGDDTFNASDGVDSFDGGANDTVFFNIFLGTFNYGDVYNFTGVGIGPGGITVDLSDADMDGNEIDNDGFGNQENIASIESIIGSEGNDTITGDANANMLNGGDGDDVLFGGDGNDILFGGNDVSGDRADYSSSMSDITANISGLIIGADIGVDLSFEIEHFTGGSGNDTVTGTALIDNDIIGGGGSDIFNATTGTDTYDGGVGDTDDLRYTSLAGDIDITWNGIANSFSILKNTSAETDTAQEIEILRATGSATDQITFTAAQTMTEVVAATHVQLSDGTSIYDVENFEGSGGNDTLYGTTSNNTINGNAGDDVIYASTGTDTLDGGVGGTDTLRFDASIVTQTVTLNLLASTATWTGGSTLFSNFEEIRLSSQADFIVGTAGNDIAVFGGNGTDTFYASDGVDEFHGEGGTDIYDFDDGGLITTSNGVTINLNLGAGQIINDGYGNTETVTDVERIIGTDFADTIQGDDTENMTIWGRDGNDDIDGGALSDVLYGENNDDTIDGNGGNDTLDGGAGIDTLNGGTGDDTLRGGAGDDFLNGDGNNAVTSFSSGGDRADYASDSSGVVVDLSSGGVNATGAGIGNDTLTGIEAVTGGSGDDTLTGDVNANRLDGGNGDDTIAGLGGTDYLDGGNGEDRLDYSAGTGINVNMETGDVTNDGFGVVTEEIMFFENITGTGGADIITGTSTVSAVNDSIDNKIDAGGGNDTIFGSEGDDEIDGEGGGGDTVNYSGISGSADVSFTSQTSATVAKASGNDSVDNVESFVLTGSGDNITMSTGVLSGLGVTVNAGGGTDRFTLVGNPDLTNSAIGTDMASVFSDIEELDLSGATTDGGNGANNALDLGDGVDDFDLSDAQVVSMTDGSNSLTIIIDSGFDLTLEGTAVNGVAGNYSLGTSSVDVIVNS